MSHQHTKSLSSIFEKSVDLHYSNERGTKELEILQEENTVGITYEDVQN